jgi:hypothetical protein
MFHKNADKGISMQIIDTSHPFYRPLWRRVFIVALCAVWALFEAVYGDKFFMMLLGALAAYSFAVLIVRYEPPVEKPKAEVVEEKDDDTTII